MKNNKSLGPAGYSSEYFKIFGTTLDLLLREQLIPQTNYCISQNQISLFNYNLLAESWKQKRFLKNWRRICH